MIHSLPSTLRDRDDRPLTIHIVGAGGNGAHFVSGLARLHTALVALGKPGIQVTLFDPDIVTAANLGRQMFSPADLGQSKAVVLIHRLNLFHGLAWKACAEPYSAAAAACWHPDIVVGCVDTKKSRRSIRMIAERSARYWLDLGNNTRDGQVILGEPVGSGTYPGIRERKMHHPLRLPTVLELCPAMNQRKAKEDDDVPSCSLAEALVKQDLFINQTLATLALNLLWTLLHKGEIDHHGYFVNLAAGRVTPLPVCPLTWARMGVDRGPKEKKNFNLKSYDKLVARKKRVQGTPRG